MKASRSQPEQIEAFIQLLEEHQRQLVRMNREVEAFFRRGRRQEPALMFPFSVLNQWIGAGLQNLERAVGRLVKAIIR